MLINPNKKTLNSISFKNALLLILILTLMQFSSLAFANGTRVNQLIFFGDSLSDNGNLYSADFAYVPQSPYFKGRFSNGYVWTDYVEKYFHAHKKIPATNYAYGGETSVLHNPYYGYAPYSLTASVNNYLMRNALVDKKHTLYIIYIGANDYLNGVVNVDVESTTVISSIKAAIERLIYYGGRNFLLINLPDLSQTPRSAELNMHTKLKLVTLAHNKKLAQVAIFLKKANPRINITLFDAHHFFNDLFHNRQRFNVQHHSNIINTHAFCWGGVGVPCANPQQYLFWDHIHPTAVMHKLLAGQIIPFISHHYRVRA